MIIRNCNIKNNIITCNTFTIEFPLIDVPTTKEVHRPKWMFWKPRVETKDIVKYVSSHEKDQSIDLILSMFVKGSLEYMLIERTLVTDDIGFKRVEDSNSAVVYCSKSNPELNFELGIGYSEIDLTDAANQVLCVLAQWGLDEQRNRSQKEAEDWRKARVDKKRKLILSILTDEEST